MLDALYGDAVIKKYMCKSVCVYVYRGLDVCGAMCVFEKYAAILTFAGCKIPAICWTRYVLSYYKYMKIRYSMRYVVGASHMSSRVEKIKNVLRICTSNSNFCSTSV